MAEIVLHKVNAILIDRLAQQLGPPRHWKPRRRRPWLPSSGVAALVTC